MKFEVELAALKGVARVEIKTVREKEGWAAYLPLVSAGAMEDACLTLGRAGIPHRFTAASEKEAQQAAKEFLEKNYRVVRMIW